MDSQLFVNVITLITLFIFCLSLPTSSITPLGDNFNNLIGQLWDILNTNFNSQLIGGFLATLVFYMFIEQRIKSLIDSSQKKKLCQQFLEEMLVNRIVAERILELNETDKFTLLKYKTSNIDTFLAVEPLIVDKEFYSQTRVLSALTLKKDNLLVDIIWFSPHSTKTDKESFKETLIDNAKLNIKSIDRILNNNKFLNEMRNLGLCN